jgi:YcaO-like protein with predicted kinase domain
MQIDHENKLVASNLSEQLNQHKAKKNYKFGTQRVCAPEQTWERIRNLLPNFGITRVADITWLDSLGIPVYVAIRPNSKTIAQSNGKGLNALQAKVSAVMESIEVWHGEELQLDELMATTADMKSADRLSYRTETIMPMPEGFFSPNMSISWVVAQDLTNNTNTYVPKELMNLDWRVRTQAYMPSFMSNTVGLASGNTLLEATLHGLCEAIECDSLVQYGQYITKKPRRLVALETVSSPLCQQLIEQYRKANAKIYLEDITSDLGVPGFQVNISLEDHVGLSTGYGCYPNRETALLRALTEAAQCRATVISGARDDIHPISYYTGRNPRSDNHFLQQLQQLSEQNQLLDYRDVKSLDNNYIEEDIQAIITTLHEKLDTSVLVTNLSRPEYDIPVVKVIVPMLEHPLHKMGSVRVSRSPQSTDNSGTNQ